MAGVDRFLVLSEDCSKVLGSVQCTGGNIKALGGHSTAANIAKMAFEGKGDEKYVDMMGGHKGGFAIVRITASQGKEAIRIKDDGGSELPTLSNIYLANARKAEVVVEPVVEAPVVVNETEEKDVRVQGERELHTSGIEVVRAKPKRNKRARRTKKV